jgi:hypothetical protein
MHDNKLRLSPDVIAKAEEIAQTWGLKNSRAAIEAVFRKYADDYQYGRQPMMAVLQNMQMHDSTDMMTASMPTMSVPLMQTSTQISSQPITESYCDALSELDSLIGF